LQPIKYRVLFVFTGLLARQLHILYITMFWEELGSVGQFNLGCQKFYRQLEATDNGVLCV